MGKTRAIALAALTVALLSTSYAMATNGWGDGSTFDCGIVALAGYVSFIVTILAVIDVRTARRGR